MLCWSVEFESIDSESVVDSDPNSFRYGDGDGEEVSEPDVIDNALYAEGDNFLNCFSCFLASSAR